tara:strand:- start:52 stop:243 length:192 start_codon:yes stop_codon:yes gene_type:complete
MYVFNYDDRETYETNFIRWRIKNTKERREMGDALLSTEEQQKIFDDQYGSNKNSFMGWVLGSS